MYFSRPLAEIHGCLLTQNEKEGDLAQRIIVCIKNILRNCKSSDEVFYVEQKINLFLAINTDLNWPQHLKELESLASCIWDFNIKPDTYLAIIRQMFTFKLE